MARPTFEFHRPEPPDHLDSQPPKSGDGHSGNRSGHDVEAHRSQVVPHHSGVDITDVQVRPVSAERLRGWATVTFNNVFVIKGIRIIMGNNRLFVAMPSRPQRDGTYQDVAHPITTDFRDHLEKVILEAYKARVPQS